MNTQSLSGQLKQMHRAGHTHQPLKQFVRELAQSRSRDVAADAQRWLDNKRAQGKIKRAAPTSGHAGLNWRHFGKKRSSRGGAVTKDRSGKKGKKE